MAKKKTTKTSIKKATKKSTKTSSEDISDLEEVDQGEEVEEEQEEQVDQNEENDTAPEELAERSGIENTEDFGKASPFVVDSLNYDVKDLPGVGAATLKKLQDAGYGTLQSIAMTPQKTIMEDTGLGDKTTASIIQAARDTLHLTYVTADQVWERRKYLPRITTGSEKIDELIGGGVEVGGITEFFGEYRTGKTQLCHQLCVNVQLPRSEGGLEGRALYIDTEGTFRPERLIQMAQAKGMNVKDVLKNVFVIRAHTSQHQVLLVKNAIDTVSEKKINLIVVDSLIAHFRSEYISRGTLATRQQMMNQHIHDLIRLGNIYPELAIVITNQVQAKPDAFFGDPNRATGGHIMAHASTIRLYLRKGKGEQRIMIVKDAPHLPEGETVFTITEDGIGDA
ncbi:MAG: DNA repair and recombination protein RadA [Promethearchaeota archaeon]|nr:MAG: DNA repair and recombination protein RadA [Candidatus Lokiarchaeota archaeon]